MNGKSSKKPWLPVQGCLCSFATAHLCMLIPHNCARITSQLRSLQTYHFFSLYKNKLCCSLYFSTCPRQCRSLSENQHPAYVRANVPIRVKQPWAQTNPSSSSYMAATSCPRPGHPSSPNLRMWASTRCALASLPAATPGLLLPPSQTT